MDDTIWYEKLRRRIDLYPVGMPGEESAIRVLRKIFTPEEAMIASELYIAPKVKTPREIAGKLGLDPAHVGKVLVSLSQRCRIMQMPYKGKAWGYALFPANPGLFELPFMVPGVTDHEKRELALAWDEYHDGSFGAELQEKDPAPMRVLPVRRSLEAQAQIYSHEDIEELIEASEIISVGNCSCRTAYRRCDAPVETCMVFDFMAEYLAARGLVRIIETNEALDILRNAEEAGLVHCSVNVKSEPSVICNCCTCCCGFLSGIVRQPVPKAVARSGFVARIDADRCNGCGSCARICPSGALTQPEEKGKSPDFNKARCLGCGLCVTHCPSNAILFQRRSEGAPGIPANWVDFTLQRWLRSGKLGSVIRHLIFE